MSLVESTFSDTDMCADDSYWHIYAASVVSNPNADYTISITIVKLGIKEYVKPYEAVVIKIETNFEVEVPFTVDFGDGTVVEVTGKEISYFWTEQGTYEINIETTIGIATISASIIFTIEDVDEGYEGDFILLDNFHDQLSQIGHIDLTSIDYAKADCMLIIGDKDLQIDFKDLEEYVEFNSVTHTFSNFGQFYMNVECNNPYGSMTNNTEFTSRKFETTFHFHEIGTEFHTEIAGRPDFYYDLIVDHSDKNVSVVHETLNNTVTIKPEFLRIQENFLSYNFEDVTIDKRILHVQNKIGQPTIHSQQFDGAWNLTTNITVRVPPGNNMFLNVSFSAGEDQVFYIHYLEQASEIVFEIFFPALGYYPITANISNDISLNSTEVLVSVEVPIRTLIVYAEDITDKAKPLILNMQINDGMQGPAKANFLVDYDNGVEEMYHYYSATYFFTTYEHEYYYPDWGTYIICVTAYNQISAVRECITVQVGEKLTYVDITMPSAGRFALNKTATSIVRCPRGSDKTYVVNFGDGEVFVFTDRYLKDTEHFEDTTTTLATTSLFVDNENKMAQSSNESSVFSENGTTSFMNGTDDVSATTVAFYMNMTANTSESGVNATTESVLKRRKRDANSTNMATTEAGTPVDFNSTSSTATAATTDFSLFNSTTTPTYLNETLENSTTNGEGNTTNVTETVTTTPTPPTTTTLSIITTTEPIPDDATDPISSNLSTARRLRDGTIKVTHRYQTEGVYTIKVKAMNHFNWVKDTLCPQVIIQAEDETPKCDSPKLKVKSKFSSSLRSPLQFFRSDQVNLTASVTLKGCKTSVATYSWRTLKIVTEDGRQIQRPHHGDNLCLLENSEQIFRYPRSSLPFGLYRVILTVSPSGHPLKASMIDFYMQINPSAPYAIIDGNEEHQWFLVYATTIIRFKQSVDPDFNTTDGIEYDLFCMKESDKIQAEKETHESLISESSLLVQGVTHKYTSKNRVRLYEYSECFEKSSNFTKDVRFPKGEFNVPSEYFVSDVTSFAIGLYVTKNNLTTSAYTTFEIRLSNSSNLLDQLDDLLASKDTTGVMRAVEALSGLLTTEPVSKKISRPRWFTIVPDS